MNEIQMNFNPVVLENSLHRISMLHGLSHENKTKEQDLSHYVAGREHLQSIPIPLRQRNIYIKL